MKKNDKFWCWWMSRNLYFRRSYVKYPSGVTLYEFEDISGAAFDLTEEQVGKLKKA